MGNTDKMTNTEMLKNKISESGLKMEYIAKSCDISRQSLSNKIANRSFFTAKEIEILCRMLNIGSLTEKERIFFAK